MKLLGVVLLTTLPCAIAQAAVWTQCGGQGYTGPTICANGSTCYYENAFFSNCMPEGTSNKGANDVATTVGGKLYFGTTVDNYQLNDAAYLAKLNDRSIFGQITPRILRWETTEAVQDFFTFEQGDAMIARAKQNGQIVRGPSCISYDQLPNWVNAGVANPGALMSALVKHCSTLIQHYAGQIYSWDVISEPFTDDGFTRPVGFGLSSNLASTYIDTILSAARAADPLAKLYITASGIDVPGPKLDSMINEIQWLQAHDIPIDGVGFKSHFAVGSVPSLESLVALYENFTALGIEVAVTELDIRMGVAQPSVGILQQQKDYATVIAACKAVKACVGVTISDISDKYSAIPAQYSGLGYALPWDANFNIKPAYDGIISGFSA